MKKKKPHQTEQHKKIDDAQGFVGKKGITQRQGRRKNCQGTVLQGMPQIGSGKSAGKAGISSESAVGPPVETPIANTCGRTFLAGAASGAGARRVVSGMGADCGKNCLIFGISCARQRLSA